MPSHHAAEDITLNHAALRSLKQYVLNMIAEDLMSGNDVMTAAESSTFFEPLREMFLSVDTDSSGDVSVQELVVGLQNTAALPNASRS